ncbi:excinuclease ABC subunit UvrC [Saccharicrinis sp. FJH2]|uniref:excinuclease ABC subunit UvrC n=1 Tax=Saccharicrinis sp. FJH65 TaxID=3344659 RepID=UPI0035F49F09
MKGENQHKDDLKKQVLNLPGKPGVYQYYDKEGKLIYVGKAKNLKKRVSSYFTKTHDSAKTSILVRKIHSIKHIVVDTEQDALLLENNLIKENQPRYNVMLKDDKTYPWICIKNEPFPRIFKTRKIIKDGSEYFGPYTSVHMVNTILGLIRQLYKLRTCNLSLTEKNIKAGKFKTCLEYHIGNCKAPCVGYQERREYEENIDHIRQILKGNISGVKHYLKDLMTEAAQKLEFELAETYRQRLEIIEKYQSKSAIVNPKISNVDVFSIIDDEKEAYVNFIKVVDGSVIQAHTMEIKKRVEEDKEDLLLTALFDIRQRFHSTSKELIVPFNLSMELEDIKFTVPQKGDKRSLLELSERNLKYYRADKLKQKQQLDKSQNVVEKLKMVQTDLHLDHLPVHLECFDNSNLQGTNPVAACVVFKNGKPSKKDYRHFNIKTVEGPNDFASMEEVVYRRYRRLLEEGEQIPQLVVIDGGKGQLGAAVSALDRLQFDKRPALIGIAKRLEEIFKPGDSIPLYLDKNSYTLKLIQQMRDEAHRFGITFHRNKRSANFISSKLEAIKGIGPNTLEILLKEFGSLKQIEEAKVQDLEKVVGKSKSRIIYNALKDK